jgi:hypothetical protein
VEDAARLLRLRLASLTIQARSDAAVQESLGDFPRIFTLESEYVAALRNAEIRFVDELLRDIEAGTLSGLDGWRRMHELRSSGASPDEVDAKLRTEFPTLFSWADQPGAPDPGVRPPESP